MATGETPLEALTELRRWAMTEWRDAMKAKDFVTAAKAAEIAAEWASKEAPYVHPRLAAIEANVTAKMTLGEALDDID